MTDNRFNFNVGNMVAVIPDCIGEISFSTITKITPVGNIRLADGSLFTPNGRLKGANSFGGAQIMRAASSIKLRRIAEDVFKRRRSLSAGRYTLAEDDIKIVFGDRANAVYIYDVTTTQGKDYYVIFFYVEV